MPKTTSAIPWNKIKAKLIELADGLWDDEESEIRRIIQDAPNDDKVISVTFQHTIDCSADIVAVKSKISFSEKFSATATGSIDDPNQMTLDEAKESNGKEKSSK